MSRIRAAGVLCLVHVLCVTALAGCAGGPRSADVASRPLGLRDLAKTDVDQVIDLHVLEIRTLLKELMLKLYRRNPAQWRASGKPSAEFMVQRVFRPERVPSFVELGGRRGADAVHLAFDPGYRGDRVLAFVAGLASMVDQAYGDKRTFYWLDKLDPQKLYNCARNFEVAAWLLRSRVGAHGQPMLRSHSAHDEDLNLSFERLIGKLIALQDMSARIVAGQTNRTIRTMVQQVATMMFLPL